MSKASGKASGKVSLTVTGYMEALLPINRQYHLTQVIESNIPSAKPHVLQAIKDCFLAELNSKKQREACKLVSEAVNEAGSDIVIKVFKNLWYNAEGKVTNQPASKVEEVVDYLREYTINRKALIEYATNPDNFSLLSKIYQVIDLIPSEGKGSKRRQPIGEKV